MISCFEFRRNCSNFAVHLWENALRNSTFEINKSTLDAAKRKWTTQRAATERKWTTQRAAAKRKWKNRKGKPKEYYKPQNTK